MYNESQREGVYADSSGHIRMLVYIGDTLVIQSIGYFGQVIYIKECTQNRIDTIKLCPESYDLGEVRVDLPHSYEVFRHRFLEIEPDRGLEIEGLPKAKIIDIPVLLDTNNIQSSEFAVMHPLSYLYYNFSKEEKSKRKVFYLERQKREQIVIDKKYNRELIENITGLHGDSITDFIAFCGFGHLFLYEATPLEIVEMIIKKFQEYTALRQEDQNP